MLREDFKSDIEFYFHLYCKELEVAGFIKEYFYEANTFDLCEPYSRKYLVQGKNKVIEKEEFLLHKSSITADFTIFWTEKARNIFYLDVTIPIIVLAKTIPFRLAKEDGYKLATFVETKGMSESSTSSSVSFPLKQKQLVKDKQIFIQKIKPFSPINGSNSLFEATFTPRKVVDLEIYKRDCKWGKKGQSKIKYKIVTLEQFLKDKL